jgi:hypothetical protein
VRTLQTRINASLVNGIRELARVEINNIEFDFWFCEEYRLHGGPPNFTIPGYPDPLGGNVFITRHDEADTTSVESGDLALIHAWLSHCERARWDWGF